MYSEVGDSDGQATNLENDLLARITGVGCGRRFAQAWARALWIADYKNMLSNRSNLDVHYLEANLIRGVTKIECSPWVDGYHADRDPPSSGFI